MTGFFCSYLVVKIWKEYFERIDKDKQKTEKFTTGITQRNCTPIDLKYFVKYFPTLFTSSTDVCSIKKGTILKTNFMGAPRWGHAAIVIGTPQFQDGIYILTVLTMTLDGRCTIQEWTNDASSHQDGNRIFSNKRMYIINPKIKVNDKIFDNIIREYVKGGGITSYDSYAAISSAFSPCFKRPLEQYIKDFFRPSLMIEPVIVDRIIVRCA